MEIKITGENAVKFRSSLKFQKWLNGFDKRFANIQGIEEGWSLWKGKAQNELVFALLFVRCLDEKGGEKGDVVFYRSDAVAVFLVLQDKDTGKKYVVLVEQLRIPSGGKLLEIPAGSVEEKDDSLATIVREVQEEVGLTISARDFKFLCEDYFSPGACNEKIALYSCEIILSSAAIKELKDKMTGTLGEDTKVKLFPLETFEQLEIKDAKTRLAYCLYMRRK